MKKSLVVLLIAVLAVSSVFATLTGTVTTTAKYNLYPAAAEDGKSYNNFNVFTEAEISGSYSLPFATIFPGGSDSGKTDNASKGYPYAVVEASLEVKASSPSKDNGKLVFDDSTVATADDGKEADCPVFVGKHKNSWKATSGLTNAKAEILNQLSYTDTSMQGVTYTLKLDTAKIVGEKWTLDFLTGPKLPNFSSKLFAVDAIFGSDPCGTEKCEEEAGYKFDSIGTGKKVDGNEMEKLESKEGFTFTWTEYGSIAVAANANEREVDSYYIIALSGVDYKLTDELNIQGAVTFNKLSDAKLKTNLSGKVAYKSAEEGKIVANAAVDGLIDNVTKENGGIEANADFAYDNKFIAGEFYYASHARYFDYDWVAKDKKHAYASDLTSSEERFSWFKFDVDGTVKAPKFTPVLSVEGVACDDQKLVADWDLKASYIENEKSYIDANIGMEDTLKNIDGQTLYGEVSTTVTNYKDLEGFGKLTLTLGCKDFLHINNTKSSIKVTVGTPDMAAKQSGFYFNAAAEDFIVKGLDFVFSAADLCNKNAQVFALDAAYADDKQVTAHAGFETGLEKNAVFHGDHTYIYGDVEVKVNDELTAYAGADAMTDDKANYYVGGKYVKNFTAEARLEIKPENGKKADIGLYARVSSEKLVKGAELALQYGALTKKGKVDFDKTSLSDVVADDSIIATCTIKF